MARDILTSLHGRRFGLGAGGEIVLNDAGGVQNLVGARVSKTITSAQLLALNATAIAIIASQGAGLAVVPRLLVLHKPAGTAYADIAAGDDLVLKYTNASGAQCSGVVEATGFLDQTTAQTRYVGMPGATGTTAGSVAPVADAAVVLHMLTGEVTTGDSPLYARLWYDVIETVFTS